MNDKKKVVILGAGPCGMTAAWELVNCGYDVTLIEKDERVGGLCRTNERSGYRFDLGGHRFITKSERLKKMVVDLLGEELLVAQRKSAILLRGKEYEYPLTVKNLFINLEFFLFAKAIIDYLKKTIKKDSAADISFEGWITNRYGKTLYDLFFGPYTEKLWGISPSEISSDWAVQRIAGLNLRDVIKNLLKVKKETERTFTRRFYYPKKGIGQMFDCIAGRVESGGGKIMTSSMPVSIGVRGDKVVSVTVNSGGERKIIPCDHLISTIPLDELTSFFSTTESEESALSFRSLRFMNILVDGDEISPNTWMYVSEAKYFMTRIQEPKKRSPHSAPDGKSSVMLEIPCNVGDEIYTMSDDELFRRSISELKELGIDLTGKTSEYFSAYADHAYPVYSIDYMARIRNHLKIIEKYNNLITCGRQGLFRYIFMDTAMVMGLSAADCIMGKADTTGIFDAGLEKTLLEVKSIV